MSEGQAASAGDATPGVVSSPEPGARASDPQAGAAEGASGAGDHGSQDYIRRVQTDPDFATQEVKGHQSRADKAVAEASRLKEWMGPLEQYTDQITGEVAASALLDHNRLLQDPVMKERIARFLQTGKVEPSTSTSQDDDDEFLTDEQKEICELRAENAEIKQRLAGTELSFGQQALTGHIEKVARDFHFTQEMFEASKAALKKNLDEWAVKARGGDKAAIQAIKNIQGPGGLKMVKSLMFAEIEPDPLLDAQQNRDRRKREGLAGLATEGLSGRASTGREPPPDFSKSANMAVDAARFAEANPEGHDSY